MIMKKEEEVDPQLQLENLRDLRKALDKDLKEAFQKAVEKSNKLYNNK